MMITELHRQAIRKGINVMLEELAKQRQELLELYKQNSRPYKAKKVNHKDVMRAIDKVVKKNGKKKRKHKWSPGQRAKFLATMAKRYPKKGNS